MSQNTLLLYNNLLALPLMAAFLLLGTGEARQVATYPQARWGRLEGGAGRVV